MLPEGPHGMRAAGRPLSTNFRRSRDHRPQVRVLRSPSCMRCIVPYMFHFCRPTRPLFDTVRHHPSARSDTLRPRRASSGNPRRISNSLNFLNFAPGLRSVASPVKTRASLNFLNLGPLRRHRRSGFPPPVPPVGPCCRCGRGGFRVYSTSVRKQLWRSPSR